MLPTPRLGHLSLLKGLEETQRPVNPTVTRYQKGLLETPTMTAAADAAPVATKTITEEEVAKVAISCFIHDFVRNSHLEPSEFSLSCPVFYEILNCKCVLQLLG